MVTCFTDCNPVSDSAQSSLEVAFLPKSGTAWRAAVQLPSIMLAVQLLTVLVGTSKGLCGAVCEVPGFLQLLLELEDISFARDVSVAVELLLEGLQRYPEAA